jgi:hypothetical protein
LTQDQSKPTEQQIQDKLFNEILPKRYPNSVIVKNWLGWSYRGEKDRRQQMRFYREFDLAVFERKVQVSIPSLVLTGFELKGFEEKSGKAPAFAEGLDQALVLLEQGADYSYLVHPEPANQDNKKALKDLCDRYAPYVGLIFVPHQLAEVSPYYSPFKEARQNPQSKPDRKKNMLTSLVTWGLRDALSDIPLWCRKQEY